MPLADASSMAYWISGLPATGSISLGRTLVAGSILVPKPALGITAVLIIGRSDTVGGFENYGENPRLRGENSTPTIWRGIGQIPISSRRLSASDARSGDARL